MICDDCPGGTDWEQKATDAEVRVSTLRRLAYELAHGNRPRLYDGRLHWYSPDENGEPHFLNGPLTDAEVAEWEALEAGE